MVVAVTVKMEGTDLPKFMSKVGVELPKETNNELYNYSKYLAKKLRLAAITDPKRPITAERRNASQLIKAKKMTNNRSVVNMPRSLVLLDAMSPHYVSLKRGRNITRWAQKNFGTATVSGKSHVRYGSRGGIKGSLFVEPHRFVQRTLNTERNKLPNYLRKAIRKAYKASGG